MSRFVNRKATKRMVLSGGCQCPGTPHDEDWVEMRTEVGAADISAAQQPGGAFAGLDRVVVAWNLLDEDGEPAAVDQEHIDLLFSDSAVEMANWITENVTASAVPNASGVHSRNGSLVNAGSRRGKRTGR